MLVLKTGITWNQLPAGLVGCSGVTCWRRLRDRTEAGVWPALHELLLAQLRAAGQLELDRCSAEHHVDCGRTGASPLPIGRAVDPLSGGARSDGRQ